MKFYKALSPAVIFLARGMLFLSAGNSIAFAEPSSISVGYLDNIRPLIYRENDGRTKGLAADYLTHFTQLYPDVRFSYQVFSDEDLMCDAFRNGRVTIALGFTQYSECRLSGPPPLLWSSSLYELTNKTNAGPKIETVYYSEKEVDRNILTRQYPHATLIQTGNQQIIVEALLAKENVAYVSSLLHADALLAEYPDTLTGKLLEHIDKVKYALRISYRTPPSIAEPLAEFIRTQGEHMPNSFETKWFDYAHFYHQPPLTLTGEQQRWIREHPVIRVAVPRYSYPVGYIDDNENFQGISAEMLKSISQKTGLTFLPVPVVTVGEMMEEIKNRRVDMGAHRAIGDGSDVALFSDPILITRFVAMVRKNDTITSELSSLKNRRLALSRGQTVRNYFLQNVPGIQILTINGTMVNGLNLIINHQADYVVAPEIIADYWASAYYAGKIRLVPLAIPALNIGFPIRKDYAILQSILNEAMADIPYSTLRTVDPHWTENISPPTTLIPRISFLLGLSVSVILVILVIICLMIYRVSLTRQQRRELEKYNNTLKTILDSTPFPVYIADHAGNLLFKNTSMQSLILNTDTAPTGIDNLFQLFTGSTDAVRDLHEQVRQKNGDVITESRFTLNHRPVFLKHWALPLQVDDRNEAGILGGWIDLTGEKTLEERLKQEKQTAINNAEEKTLFLAQISHEIRTPLSIIIGLMELISDKARSMPRARLAQQAQIAFRNTSALLGLLDQLIQFAREGRQHAVDDGEKTVVNLRQLLEDTSSLFAIRAAEKGLRFHHHFNSSAGTLFLCERLKIQQLLNNLLSNALKFTVYGSVSVSTRIRPGRETNAVMEIEVTDTGPGIRKEHLERIFEVFEQADNVDGSREGGFGLGLAICRQLSIALGGTISLTSQYGQGTRVTLNIPLQHPAETDDDIIQPTPDTDFTMLHIAVLEDNEASRFLLKTQLEEQQVIVSEVNTFAELDTMMATDFPDAIISDFEMGSFSGLDVLHHLNHRNVFPPPCYIHTANAGKSDVERYLDAGATGVIIKPVSLSDLTMTLSDIVMRQPLQRFMQQMEILASGRRDTLEAMLRVLRESIRTDAEQLAITSFSDRHKIRQHVHSLKGVLSMIKQQNVLSLCDAYLSAVEQDPELRTQTRHDLISQLEHLTGMIEECERRIESPRQDPTTSNAPTRG
ncbi:transporter substrate-binding domain-containing protein [Enterobacter pseudoroggenkampii]|uniref:ATP-binding protein n=1 Tax=Enterobacter pseudoroggenkampii TaxID=2996112 RepID=UPI0025B1C282|nr:transporter substrate-binding domain-containing protein [Enterobacter pseudoroggenkampii]WJW96585.1 transporter substrate-binding domain-containing protein [Enterobacter pseudoroggenkampii]